MKHFSLTLPVCLSLFMLMCSPQNQQEEAGISPKLDPRLRAALEGTLQTAADTPIDVLLKFKAPLTPEQQGELDNAGVKLQSTIGDIATASLTREAVRQVAQLDFVVYLQYAKEQKVAPQ